MRRMTILFLLIAVAPGCSVARESPPCWMTADFSEVITTEHAILKSELLATHLDQPVEDARLRIAHGDFRVLIIGGFTGRYPAIDLEREGEIVCQYGARFVQGTGDSYDNEAHVELAAAFERYATAYNRYLLEYWRSSK